MNHSILESSALSNIRDFELKKHVHAIHCTNSFSLLQRKMFNALLFNAYPELSQSSCFTISISTLRGMIGYNSKDYNTLKKAFLNLMKTTIEWNITNNKTDDLDGWKACTALSSVSIKSGKCTYEYSSVMRDLLHTPSLYGRLDMKLIPAFKSNFGLALYENCIRYQGLPNTAWFSIDEFRKLMGVDDSKYMRFCDFKRKVLNVAIQEFNTLSPIKAEVELSYCGRKVEKLRFLLSKRITGKGKGSTKHDSGSKQNSALLKSLLQKGFFLSNSDIETMCVEYDLAYINEKVDLIMQSKNFRDNKIKSISAYLKSALKNDYKPSSSSAIKNTTCLQQSKDAINVINEGDKRLKYEAYVVQMVTDYVSTLSKESYDKLLNGFIEAKISNNPLFKKWYEEKGLESKVIKHQFSSFVIDIHKEHIKLLSFEEFKLGI